MERTFNIGNGQRISCSHFWLTTRNARGAARFTKVYRMCDLLEVNDNHAVIRLVGLKSKPRRKIPFSQLINASDAPKPLNVSV